MGQTNENTFAHQIPSTVENSIFVLNLNDGGWVDRNTPQTLA